MPHSHQTLVSRITCLVLRFVCVSVCPVYAWPSASNACIGVASYGALGHVPPLDFQLVILGITRFTDSDESCARFSVQ